MLAQQPVDVMITSSDLGVAKRFYGERIGLDVLIDTDDFVTFGCGGDSRLVVTRTSSRSDEQQTKASWRVGDVAAEVAELRARYSDMIPGCYDPVQRAKDMRSQGIYASVNFPTLPRFGGALFSEFKDKELG